MKKLVLIILVLLLVSCTSEESLSVEEYSEAFYKELYNLESTIEKDYYANYAGMMQVRSFTFSYNHELYQEGKQKTIDKIDETLYELSQLGPQIDDVELLKYQSRLENALFDWMNHIKTLLEHDDVSRLMVNQFNMYKIVEEYFAESNDVYLKVQENLEALESRLVELGYSGSKEYYDLRLNNKYRHAYIWTVIGGNISTYQDYVGLVVSPRSPFIYNFKGEYPNVVLELSPTVMFRVFNNLTDSLEAFDVYHEKYAIDKNTMRPTRIYLDTFIEDYETYAQYRYELPHDFFRSLEFMEYQTYSKELFNAELLNFDPKYNEEYHFDIIQDKYLDIFFALNNEPHYNYLNY
jgi:hypothetical protein